MGHGKMPIAPGGFVKGYQKLLSEYLNQWRERFWLFHPEHPFMQAAVLANADETKDKLKAWTQIAIEKPSPSEPALFDHAIDTAPIPTSCANAFRNFLGYLQFVPGKLVQSIKVSDKAGPLADSAAAIPLGNNLGETIFLSLHPFDARRTDDLPAWEKSAIDLDLIRSDSALATGPNDRYTRQSRAVLLLPNETFGEISHILFGAGIALMDDPNAPDPMSSYRINKEGKAIRVSFSDGRSLWRDLPSLLPDPSRSFNIPPAVLGWAANLYTSLGEWDTYIPVLAAGLASNQAKLERWRAERIVLPETLLTKIDAAKELRAQVRFSEEIFLSTKDYCTNMVALSMPDSEHKDTRSRSRQIVANSPAAVVFFATAERALPKLMREITTDDIDAAIEGWANTLILSAKQSWEAVRQSLGDSPAVLRADAKTWPRFNDWLKSLTPNNKESATKETTA